MMADIAQGMKEGKDSGNDWGDAGGIAGVCLDSDTSLCSSPSGFLGELD